MLESSTGSISAKRSASRTLKHLHTNGDIEQVTRGVWCQPKHPLFSSAAAIPFLLAGAQGYLSFLSALHRHGVISQIPQVFHVATLGHSRKLYTPIGHFEFFQIDPAYMASVLQQGSLLPQELKPNGHYSYYMATPEQAFLDTLHVSTKKGKRFSRFPELDLSLLNPNKLKQLLQALPENPRIRVQNRLREMRHITEMLKWPDVCQA